MTSWTLAAVDAVPVTLHRYGAYDRTGLRPTRGAVTDSTLVVSVQQPTPDDLRVIGGEYDARDVLVIISDDALRIGDRAAQLPPDEVTARGRRYRVMQVSESDPLGPIPRSYRSICVGVQALESQGGA